MHEKLLFVYNPTSGKKMIRQRLTEIIGLFTEAGYDVIAHPTIDKGDAGQTVERFCKKVDLVVCSGGDGTLDDVVSAVMKTDPKKRIGYIPSGSTNDFGHSLGIPRDLVRAAKNIVDGSVFRCDVGSFNEEYFVYVAAFGAFTSIAYETSQSLKHALGHAAYLTHAGAQVFKLPRHDVTVEIDGVKISGTYTYGMVTNAKFVGGMRNVMGPAVDMSDGLFEVTLVHVPTNPIEMSEIVTTMLSARLESPLVEVYKGSHVIVRTKDKVDWTLDGEFGGSHKRVEINNLHRALHLMHTV